MPYRLNITSKTAHLFLVIALAASAAHAQPRELQSTAAVNILDLATSAASGKFSAALSFSRHHSIALKNKLQVGYGLRFTSFIGANQYYTTAPAKYTSPVQNLGTIFSKTITENIDTITTATTAVHALNLAMHLQFAFNPRIDFGFNIDVVGLSFGSQKQFNIISSSFDGNQTPVQAAAPTTFNLLLTSDNDIGSLNSEFFVRYWLSERVGLRIGYTFLFSEYTTNNPLSFNSGEIVNDRYRLKASMLLLAISFKPFNAI